MVGTILITLHAALASIALVLGAVVLLRRSKGDRAHRIAGRVWVLAMYVAILSSFGIRVLNPGHFSLFHALSIFTLCTLTLGLRAARRGNVAAHRGFMRGSYLGLLGAFVGAVAVPSRAIPQLVVHSPATFALDVVAVLAVSLTILGFATRGGRRNAPIAAQELGVVEARPGRSGSRKLDRGPTESGLTGTGAPVTAAVPGPGFTARPAASG